MLSDIAQRESTQQRVAQGVQQYVTIRMGHAALRVGNLHPAQHQRKPLGKRMDIVSVPDSQICHNRKSFLQMYAIYS